MLHEFLGTPAPAKTKSEGKTLTWSIQFVQYVQRPRKNHHDEIKMHVKILDHHRRTKKWKDRYFGVRSKEAKSIAYSLTDNIDDKYHVLFIKNSKDRWKWHKMSLVNDTDKSTN